MSNAPSRFHGIIPPLATPLVDRDTLDVAGLERLIEHVLAGGVHGLFVLGTTGEGPALPPALPRAVLERTVNQDAGREPLERWCRTLVAGLPLPLLLYNMPEMVKVVLEPELVRRLADSQKIVGLKDSGGDLETFAGYSKLVREVRPDWSLLIGPEQMLPQAHALGGHGGVCGGANVNPRVFVDLQAALERGDEARAAGLQQKVLALGRLYTVGTEPGRVIVGVKAALAALGICGDASAAWFEQLDAAQKTRIAEIVAEIGT